MEREVQPRRSADGRLLTMYLDEDAAVVKRRDVSDAWVDSLYRFVERQGLEPYRMSGAVAWEGPKFSLLRADGPPRPAYTALAAMPK